MFTRKTSVAGIFYPGEKNELIEIIDDFMKNVHNTEKIINLKAVVCPHAGYIYSGQVAAYSYKAISENLESISNKTIVLLCPSHYVSLNKVAVGLYDKLETPLGDLNVDKIFGRKLLKEFPDYFTENYVAFEQEHSLEVQLPFLKYIFGNMDIKVLPLVFGGINLTEIGIIFDSLYKKEELFFIVSSDLSHYKSYETARNIDEKTLESFISLDSGEIIKRADACGIYPWIVLNEIAKQNNWNTKILKYLNSGDTAGDKANVVGYASLIYT